MNRICVLFTISAAGILTQAPAAFSQAPVAPVISPVTASSTTITVNCTSGATVRLTFANPDLDPIDQPCAANGTATITVSAGGLTPGQVISAIQSSSGADSGLATITVPATNLFWGRTRANGSAGIMLSKDREEFSKADMFLELETEKNWIQGKNNRFYVTTFFDAFLTAVPVAPNNPTSEVAAPTTPASGGTGNGTGTGTGMTGNTGTTATTTPGNFDFDTFKASKKAAILRVGLYAPVVISKWQFGGAEHGLFVGPVAKAGIQTILDRKDQQTGGAVTSNTQVYDDLYNFHSIGARFGHLELNKDRNSAPELMSYLDLSMGRFENFEFCRVAAGKADLTSCTDPALKQLLRVRPWRYVFEGRLKIPSKIPMYVGFYANGGKGPDDLRFVFGTSFDLAKLKF